MTLLSALLASVTPRDGGFTADVTDDWRQGRTLYGGLSAALCVAAAERALPDLPPLRSAQFAFLGPASGTIHAVPALLRQGKSTAFVTVDFSGDAGLAVRALLCFGAARASALAHTGLPMPAVPHAPTPARIFSAARAPRTSRSISMPGWRAARP